MKYCRIHAQRLVHGLRDAGICQGGEHRAARRYYKVKPTVERSHVTTGPRPCPFPCPFCIQTLDIRMAKRNGWDAKFIGGVACCPTRDVRVPGFDDVGLQLHQRLLPRRPAQRKAIAVRQRQACPHVLDDAGRDPRGGRHQ